MKKALNLKMTIMSLSSADLQEERNHSPNNLIYNQGLLKKSPINKNHQIIKLKRLNRNLFSRTDKKINILKL